jgi:hypothetical protein
MQMMLQVYKLLRRDKHRTIETREERNYVRGSFQQTLVIRARGGVKHKQGPPVGGKIAMTKKDGKIKGEKTTCTWKREGAWQFVPDQQKHIYRGTFLIHSQPILFTRMVVKRGQPFQEE